MKLLAAAAALLALAGCAPRPLVPDASRLAPWTLALRDAQHDGPQVAVYRHRGQPLVVVGAVHENDVASPTFRLIGEAYGSYRFDAVLVEGVEHASGPDPAGLLAYVAASEPEGTFQPGGETVPTVEGALRQRAAVWGGEPSDADVLTLATATATGVTAEDVLGFYVLRVVPQWLREGEVERPTDPGLRALVEAELAAQRPRLGLGADVLPSYESWAGWYARTNGRPLGGGFQTEEVGPLSDGPHGTNRVAYAVSRARDAFLLDRIAEHLGRGEAVLVVYGASHLTILRPALDALLGPPCHTGADLAGASC